MAKINGGIIGPNNPTGPFSAGGVWRLEDAFNAQKAGTWPLVLGYQIPNSLRFNSGSSDSLSRTTGSTGNRKTVTFSSWFKRSSLSGNQIIFSWGGGGLDIVNFFFNGSPETLNFYNYPGSLGANFTTNQLFRDVGAWYHIVLAVDTTQATDTNRIKLYVNGSQVTSFSAITYPTLNEDFEWNISGEPIRIGANYNAGGDFINGYLAETYIIDGQQLTPSSFGQTDATTGIWTPLPYTGTYGTNGFFLKFQDSSALGDDTSGNGNDFTANNLTSIDQSYDSPTNNFNTLNSLIPLGSNFSAPTQGNLSLSSSGTGDSGFFASTIIPSAGKWYFEVKTTVVSSSDRTKISIANFESVTGTNNIETGDYKGISVSTGTTGRIAVTNGATTTEFDVAGYVPVANDIMIFAVDMDNSRVYIGKNGTWFTTAAASGGNPATATGYFSPVLGNGFAVGAGHGAGVSASATNLYNFGYPPFTISSGNADANGFGNFEYAVPSGYYALCTKNLALYG